MLALLAYVGAPFIRAVGTHAVWLLAVNYLWAFVDADRRFLHDRIAGTRSSTIARWRSRQFRRRNFRGSRNWRGNSARSAGAFLASKRAMLSMISFFASSGADPRRHAHPFAGLEILVMLEEMRDLPCREFGKIARRLAPHDRARTVRRPAPQGSWRRRRASSSIFSMPIGRQRTTTPVMSGIGERTSTSHGSPSSDSVRGM